MSFTEDDLLPISALQHLLFCERQAALIHLEQLWAENTLTVQGRHLHERVDTAPGESRGDVRFARALPLRSLRLGLVGRADLVELHRIPADAAEAGEPGASLPGVPGVWRPFPVEYKRGRPKPHHADLVQLCAQALCLEEMLGTPVPAGALFYGETRRRHDVAFDAAFARERRFHTSPSAPPSRWLSFHSEPRTRLVPASPSPSSVSNTRRTPSASMSRARAFRGNCGVGPRNVTWGRVHTRCRLQSERTR